MNNSTNTKSPEKSYWTMPEGLGPLAAWLTNRGVNIHTLNSDREALHLACQLSYRQTPRQPRNGTAIPALTRLQKELCATEEKFKSDFYRERWPMAREPFLRSTGPASPVRGVSAKTYAEIVDRYGLEPRSN
ncbi:MAG: hypothetical protein AAGF25_06290 [Pseudomonadota bacterium]